MVGCVYSTLQVGVSQARRAPPPHAARAGHRPCRAGGKGVLIRLPRVAPAGPTADELAQAEARR